MIHDPRPLAPINSEKLDDIAKVLLDEACAPNIVTPADIPNPESYLLLKERLHGSYSYPDLVVRMHRLEFTDEARKIAQGLGLTPSNTAKEQNGVCYMGGINHQQAIDIVKGLNFIPICLRLYADFLKEIKAGIDGKKVYDGAGSPISIERLLALWNEITEVREPYRAEHLDNSFSSKAHGLEVIYHQIQSDGSLKETSEVLEGCLMNKKTPGIDLYDWLNRATIHGFPPADVKDGSLYYWSPADGKIARFDALSAGAGLYCFGVRRGSGASLGVRVAKIKG